MYTKKYLWLAYMVLSVLTTQIFANDLMYCPQIIDIAKVTNGNTTNIEYQHNSMQSPIKKKNTSNIIIYEGNQAYNFPAVYSELRVGGHRKLETLIAAYMLTDIGLTYQSSSSILDASDQTLTGTLKTTLLCFYSAGSSSSEEITLTIERNGLFAPKHPLWLLEERNVVQGDGSLYQLKLKPHYDPGNALEDANRIGVLEEIAPMSMEIVEYRQQFLISLCQKSADFRDQYSLDCNRAEDQQPYLQPF